MHRTSRALALFVVLLPLCAAGAARAQDSDGDGYGDGFELRGGSHARDSGSTPLLQSGPAMFEASFILHAFGNDSDTGTTPPYSANGWTALPLGYDCQHAEKYSGNVLNSRYCSPAKMQRGHPATGMGAGTTTSKLSVMPGTPVPGIVLQQSALGIELYTHPLTGTDTDTPHCCRGFPIQPPSYAQTFTYATFVNAAGSFFAGGGAAAAGFHAAGTGAARYNNYTGMQNHGTWQIRAGVNAFGGAMGLLGKYGAKGKWSSPGVPTFYEGTTSWGMVPDIGRKIFNTVIGYGAMGTTLFQNPFTRTDKRRKYFTNGSPIPGKTSTVTAIGLGTLWTTGQVGNFALAGSYATSLWRTGFDTFELGGARNIQLVTPGLTHWLREGPDDYTAHVGILKLRIVPEPGRVALLALGLGALLALRRWGGWVR